MSLDASLTDDRLGARRDDVYAALLAAHEGLSAEESAALNARLVLLLANMTGDAAGVIAACAELRRRMDEARGGCQT